MTSTTPDHDAVRCHAAAEDRRQLLCRIKILAERLDDCDRAALKAAGCGDLFGGAGAKGPRHVNPDPALAPLIVYPEFPPKPDYKLKVPESNAKAELIAGYVKSGCDCVRRNGLQDQCELSECQGRPLCLTTPVPLCPPSGGGRLQVTAQEAAAIVNSIDRDRCCRLDCCPGLMDNC